MDSENYEQFTIPAETLEDEAVFLYDTMEGITALVSEGELLGIELPTTMSLEITECAPGVDNWIDTLPVGEVIRRIFTGNGDCTEILWQFLGLSIPAWSALMFSGFAVFGLRQLFFRRRYPG